MVGEGGERERERVCEGRMPATLMAYQGVERLIRWEAKGRRGNAGREGAPSIVLGGVGRQDSTIDPAGWGGEARWESKC